MRTVPHKVVQYAIRDRGASVETKLAQLRQAPRTAEREQIRTDCHRGERQIQFPKMGAHRQHRGDVGNRHFATPQYCSSIAADMQ
jgi:hypothetical protein